MDADPVVDRLLAQRPDGTLLGSAVALRTLAGFRNLVVHGHERIDLGIVRDVVENRLGDLPDFCTSIRAALVRET